MTETPQKLTAGQMAARAALIAVVLAVAFGIVGALVMTQEEPAKVARENLGALVSVIELAPSEAAISVSAEGTVMAAEQISLMSEVTGRVVWVSPNLVPGGQVKKGEPLIRLDARDYRLRAEQLLSQVDSAKLNLEIERSRKQIAEREWELLGEGKPADGESLALRDPQLRSAQVSLRSAESVLEQAQLAVTKTTLRAPFNALIQQKTVGVGQIASPQAQLATLVGTDSFWVQAVLPIERLAWIQIPGVSGAEEGSRVRVTQNLGGQMVRREGRVVRLLGDLDPRGRMARVLVEIDDPLGTAEGDDNDIAATDTLPLLLGAYVSLEIMGPETDDVLELPRVALRNDDQVFAMTADNTLAVKDVRVVWRRPDTVLIERSSSGLEAGDAIITSPLSAPIEGMKLRTLASSAEGSAERSDARLGARPTDTAGASASADEATPDAPAGGAASTTNDDVQGPKVAKPSR
ncbi:MAG: efflux RND transporter periplasmic adaptor subunit [Haliangiales bacterium]